MNSSGGGEGDHTISAIVSCGLLATQYALLARSFILFTTCSVLPESVDPYSAVAVTVEAVVLAVVLAVALALEQLFEKLYFKLELELDMTVDGWLCIEVRPLTVTVRSARWEIRLIHGR